RRIYRWSWKVMGTDVAGKSSLVDAIGCRPAVGRGKPSDAIRFFTIAAVADMTDVSTRTVRRWITHKGLVAHHFGSAVRIAESDLRDFLARHRNRKPMSTSVA